jgi:integration host factor subunit alpha
MTLTKEHPRLSIENQVGVSEFESSRILESVLETVKTTLANGEDVLIKGRNPKTGERLTLEPRRVVTFKCTALLGDKIKRFYEITDSEVGEKWKRKSFILTSRAKTIPKK